MDAKRKRELVLTEFVQTEETYVRDLKILADTFKTPLQDRLSATDLMKIFSNVDMLIMFHQELVLSLKAQTLLFYEEQTVGATLLKYVIIHPTSLLVTTIFISKLYIFHPSRHSFYIVG